MERSLGRMLLLAVALAAAVGFFALAPAQAGGGQAVPAACGGCVAEDFIVWEAAPGALGGDETAGDGVGGPLEETSEKVLTLKSGGQPLVGQAVGFVRDDTTGIGELEYAMKYVEFVLTDADGRVAVSLDSTFYVPGYAFILGTGCRLILSASDCPDSSFPSELDLVPVSFKGQVLDEADGISMPNVEFQYRYVAFVDGGKKILTEDIVTDGAGDYVIESWTMLSQIRSEGVELMYNDEDGGMTTVRWLASILHDNVFLCSDLDADDRLELGDMYVRAGDDVTVQFVTADGEPIADARIELDYQYESVRTGDVKFTETKAGTTDADGMFSIQVSGDCELSGCEKRACECVRVFGTPYTVDEVEVEDSTVVVTANESRYHIEVVDEAGKPVADVDAAYSLRVWGATVPFEVAGTETVIEAVPADEIYIAIAADGCTFRTTAGAAGEDGRYVVEAKEGVGVDAKFICVPEPVKMIRVYQRTDVDDSLASIEEGVPVTAGTVEWEVFADDECDSPVRTGCSPIGADGYAAIPEDATRVHFSIEGYEVRGYYALGGVEGGKVNGYPAVADSVAGWYDIDKIDEFGAWEEGDAPAVFKVKFSVDGAAFSTDDGVPVGSMINDCLFEEGAMFGFVVTSDGEFNKIGLVTGVDSKEGLTISDNCIPYAYTKYSFERWCVNGEDSGNLQQIVVGYDDAASGGSGVPIVYVSATFTTTETVLADGAGYEPVIVEPVSVAIEVAGGYVYNGREQSVSFTVTVDGAAVPRDRLIVSGDVGTGAGEYTLEARSAGADFPGAVSVEWSIAPKALNPSMICLLGGVPQCDGTMKHAQFCVSDGAAVLERGRDFDVVSGEAGVDSGDYALIVEGVGNYAGKALAIWRIAPAPAPAAPAGLSDPTAAFIAAAGLVALAAMAFAAVRLRRP